MSGNVIETVMGAVVLVVAALFHLIFRLFDEPACGRSRATR